jgi:hypothetical protein
VNPQCQRTLDGNGGGDDFAPFVHLAGVTATALTEYNLGFNPIGNRSPVAPAAPMSLALSAVSDTGAVGDNITSVIRPTVTGTAVSGDTIYLYDGANLIGTSVVADGTWAITPDVQLALGLHSFTAIAADGVGNTSAASPSLNITIEAATPQPSAPPVVPTDLALAADSDTGVIGDNITSAAKPTITGTATSGDTVYLYNGATLVGTGAVAGGTWAITLAAPLALGSHTFTATAADSTGSTSAASPSLNIIIEATTPQPPSPLDAPSGLALTTDSDTGIIGDNITSVAKPTITGTATTGDTVSLYDGATLVGTGLVVDGTWAITPGAPLALGPHTFTATATIDPAWVILSYAA